MGLEITCKIENEVKIGGFKISIVEVRDMFRDTGRLGEYQHAPQKILVDQDIPSSLKNETKLHEFLEAINLIYDLKMNHDQIQILGVALHQIFEDNE